MRHHPSDPNFVPRGEIDAAYPNSMEAAAYAPKPTADPAMTVVMDNRQFTLAS